jgi:hypothetical protein
LVGPLPQPTKSPASVITSAPTKPKADWNYEEVIFYPPPRVNQHEAYKGEEAWFACWATAAEMIVRWRNENEKFSPPDFVKKIPVGTPDSEQEYMDYVNRTLSGWGFQLIPGASLALFHEPGQVPFRMADVPGFTADPKDIDKIEFEKWTTPLLATQLNAYGPLYCVGSFWKPNDPNKGRPKLQHAIAVFGAQWGKVYYRDPWDGRIEVIPVNDFDSKLLRSAKNMYKYAYAYARFGK